MEQKAEKTDLAHQLLEYRDVLFSYIMAMVRDWNDAEEIFQEVSVTILEKEKQNYEVHSFKAWSREVARRKVLDFWRTRKRRKTEPLSEEIIDSIDDSYRTMDEKHKSFVAGLIERINACIKKLPEKLRRLIHFRYRDNLSFQHIGKKMNKSATATQVALYRARMALHKCVQKIAGRG